MLSGYRTITKDVKPSGEEFIFQKKKEIKEAQ